MNNIVKQIVLLLITIIMFTTVKAQKKNSALASSRSKGSMLTMLQGRWSSLDDKKTFFQIQGNRQIDMYGKDILDTATINFYDDCPKRISDEDNEAVSGKYLVVALKPNDFYCYSIEKISSQQLVLMYLPKGSILRYKKVPSINLENYNTPGED